MLALGRGGQVDRPDGEIDLFEGSAQAALEVGKVHISPRGGNVHLVNPRRETDRILVLEPKTDIIDLLLPVFDVKLRDLVVMFVAEVRAATRDRRELDRVNVLLKHERQRNASSAREAEMRLLIEQKAREWLRSEEDGQSDPKRRRVSES